MDLEETVSVAVDLTPLTQPLSFQEFPAKCRRKLLKREGLHFVDTPRLFEHVSGRDELPRWATGAESLSF